MAETTDHLALDLGAESGRGLLGRFDGQRLELQELHRFPNLPVQMLDTLVWDLPRLFAECKTALGKAASSRSLDSVGIDTWGIDFGLIGWGNTLLGNPVHYRDRRTDGLLDVACSLIPRREIYDRSGLQFLPFNTAYQLLSMARSENPLLKNAETLLMMPDLLAWLFTGERLCERTDASTTQLYDPNQAQWSEHLCLGLGLPREILPELIDPGTEIGPLSKSVTNELNIPPVRVLATAGHDTASAVAAVPARTSGADRPDWCYLSSGTWSLLGVETPRPIINDLTYQGNFTNEGGVSGTTRLLKNIMGLWLVQECRRTWKKQGREFSYDELESKAERSRPFAALIDPDDASFLSPGDMPARISAYCQKTGQTPPSDEGGFVRCCFESLALRYRWTVLRLEQILGSPIQTIHIVGGGLRNTLLNQFTADACARPVLAGPVEATAIGNMLVQAMGRGRLGSLSDIRAVVARSFPPSTFEPKDTAAWEEAAQRFEGLVEG